MKIKIKNTEIKNSTIFYKNSELVNSIEIELEKVQYRCKNNIIGVGKTRVLLNTLMNYVNGIFKMNELNGISVTISPNYNQEYHGRKMFIYSVPDTLINVEMKKGYWLVSFNRYNSQDNQFNITLPKENKEMLERKIVDSYLKTN